jgi:hypothetical protein
MGRTIHFSLKKENSFFTKKELIFLDEISTLYNSDTFLSELKDVYGKKNNEIWNFENFYISYKSNYLPNKPYDDDYVENKIKELRNRGLDDYAIYKKLFSKKIIYYFSINPFKTCELRSFVKVYGDEFNAYLVYNILIHISKKLKNVKIRVEDEGEYLITPVFLQNGKAIPDLNSVYSDIRRYLVSGDSLLKQKVVNSELFKNLPDQFVSDININNFDHEKDIFDELANLNLIYQILKNHITYHYELYIYNLEKRDVNKWFDPHLFTRTFDIQKFIDYDTSKTDVMDGFYGEAYGLVDDEFLKRKNKEMMQILEKILNTFKNK